MAQVDVGKGGGFCATYLHPNVSFLGLHHLSKQFDELFGPGSPAHGLAGVQLRMCFMVSSFFFFGRSRWVGGLGLGPRQARRLPAAPQTREVESPRGSGVDRWVGGWGRKAFEPKGKAEILAARSTKNDAQTGIQK